MWQLQLSEWHFRRPLGDPDLGAVPPLRSKRLWRHWMTLDRQLPLPPQGQLRPPQQHPMITEFANNLIQIKQIFLFCFSLPAADRDCYWIKWGHRLQLVPIFPKRQSCSLLLQQRPLCHLVDAKEKKEREKRRAVVEVERAKRCFDCGPLLPAHYLRWQCVCPASNISFFERGERRIQCN